MIRYSLRCDDGHLFESWFQSSAAFDRLAAGGLLACAICGGNHVKKAVMAPRVANADAGSDAGADERADADAAPETDGAAAPSMPLQQGDPGPAQMRKQLAALRRHVESTADYVGDAFSREARDIHEGRAPERPIYGEARPEDARKLIEDGVPVAPLPIIPTRKVN